MYKDDMNDDIITSEAIWTFENVEEELLRPFPNGKYLSEEIQTIGGETWRVDFYPNGKDLKSFGQIILCVTLIQSKENQPAINAECSFSFKNINRRKNYFGKIPLTSFEDDHTEENSTLDNLILKECGTSYPINVTITIYQYPQFYEFPKEQLLETTKSEISNSNNLNTLNSISSATPRYNFIPGDQFDDDDFKKVKVNYLYNKKVLF